MFQIPFSVEIWGTVSDWVMIIVTIVTAIFLYRTLKSQQEVQKAQNKLLEIEQIRLIEQFKPVITYHRFRDETEDKYAERLVDELEFLFVKAKNVSDNIAINYKFVPPKTSEVETLEWFTSQPNLIGDEFGAIYFIIKKVKTPINYNFHFLFTYSDLIGTYYEQRVYCSKDEFGEIVIRTHVPAIVK